ncbi:MAG: hypothetical protein ABIM58_04035 [candidate division WOR-3 bacterium]
MRILFLILFITLSCVTVYEHHGPPPHAKAYGLRKKIVYWYYPSLEIYYHPERNVYIIFQGGKWVEVIEKPKDIEIYDYVVIETEEEKPWLKHSYYKMKYPAKKGKEKGKK